MYKIIYEIYYRLMAIFVNIELYWKNVMDYLEFNKVNINTSIILVNNEKDEIAVLDNIDSDMNTEYDFGIIQKEINGKTCQYLFDELDTNDIPTFFSDPIKNVIFSLEISYNEENYLIDTTSINYGFEKNILFFKDHIVYIMKKYENIDIEDDYILTMIDHNCNIITIKKNQYLYLSQHIKNSYKIITN